MKKEDFVKYYSNLSNVELLKIIEEKEKYQPVAIEVAREILSERNYSTDELNVAQTEINFSLNKKLEQREKINKKINSINEFIDEHFGLRERSPEKILNLFCAGLFLYTFFSGIFNIRHVAGYYYSTFASWSIAILTYIIQLLIIYLLYRRSNWGWVLIVAGCIILASQNIQSFISFFSYRNEFFFIPINPYTQLLASCINIGTVSFLNAKKIREQFTIAKDSRIVTIVVSLVISVFLIFVF